jgi:REP element-mobilizing transposase RayT
MIQKWWVELPMKFDDAGIDEFIIMPNHFHGIIVLKDPTPERVDLRVDPIPTIIQWFKAMTTNEYIRCAKQLGWSPLSGKLWHRNYYEHIIRHEREFEAIRHYIHDNPIRWESDRNNPTNILTQSPETASDDPTNIRFRQ